MVIADVAGSDLMFGLGHMWQILVDDSPFKAGVLRLIDEANKWIAQNVEKLTAKDTKSITN